jgi:hypothetical protein
VNLWSGLAGTLAAFADSRIEVRSSGSLLDDLRLCDVVFGGNSTVLLDSTIAGTPSCYVRGFDHGPYDVQGFVRDGLIFEWVPEKQPDLAAIDRFYNRANWTSVLRRYADIDRADEDVALAVRAALDRLAPAFASHGNAA